MSNDERQAAIVQNPVLAAALSEGNRLIADFMGVKIGVDNYSWRIGCSEPLQEKHLNYHKEWGWIMPVAKKCIESYEDNRQDIFQALNEVDINKLWLACVEFIQWFNEFKAVPKR